MVVPAFQILPPAPRVLIFRSGALGDFLLTLPVFRGLRRAWPKADITVVGIPRIAELARMSGLVDRVLDIESARFGAYYAPGDILPPGESDFLGSFDLVISFLHDPDGALRSNWERAGARRVIGVSPRVGAGHAADHFMTALEPLCFGVREPCSRFAPRSHRFAEEKRKCDLRTPKYAFHDGLVADGPCCVQLNLPTELQSAGRIKLKSLGLHGPVIAIHPGSGSRKKNWPLGSFLALAGKIREAGLGHVLWIAGEADEAIRHALGGNPPLVSSGRGSERRSILTGCDLPTVAAVLGQCRAYAGNDSGITHLAAAVGVPTVALFGPTDPGTWGPRGRQVAVLGAKPPTTAGLARITVAEVLRELRAFEYIVKSSPEFRLRRIRLRRKTRRYPI